MKFLELNEKYEKKFRSLIESIFTIIHLSKENKDIVKFSYKLLNVMIAYTFSNEDIWFFEIVKNYGYLTSNIFSGTTEYMIFVSIYMYYAVYLEQEISEKFKSEIKEAVKRKGNKSTFEGDSWQNILKHKLQYMRPEDATELLSRLLYIFDTNDKIFNWYFPNNKSSYKWETSKSFGKDLIINWWIGFVLTSENILISAFNKEGEVSIPDLNRDDLLKLARILNENWFSDGVINKDIDLNSFKMYGLNDYIDNRELVEKLNEFQKSLLYGEIVGELDLNIKTPGDLKRYKDMFSKGIHSTIKNMSYLDKSINMESIEKKQIALLIDTVHSDQMIEMHINGIKKSFEWMFYSAFVSDDNVSKKRNEVLDYDENVLREIIDFEAVEKNAHIYKYNPSPTERILIDNIDRIPTVDGLILPYSIFLKKDAIRVNYVYIEDESFVRNLTNEEINVIIDRDYKLVNGLYAYKEAINNVGSLFITREELFQLLSKKYFYVKIILKFNYIFDAEKIMYIVKKNKLE